MKIPNKYHLEQKVYLITDPEQYPRMVVAVTVSIGNIISYSLACGSDGATEHYEPEVTDEKNVIGDIP